MAATLAGDILKLDDGLDVNLSAITYMHPIAGQPTQVRIDNQTYELGVTLASLLPAIDTLLSA